MKRFVRVLTAISLCVAFMLSPFSAVAQDTQALTSDEGVLPEQVAGNQYARFFSALNEEERADLLSQYERLASTSPALAENLLRQLPDSFLAELEAGHGDALMADQTEDNVDEVKPLSYEDVAQLISDDPFALLVDEYIPVFQRPEPEAENVVLPEPQEPKLPWEERGIIHDFTLPKETFPKDAKHGDATDMLQETEMVAKTTSRYIVKYVPTQQEYAQEKLQNKGYSTKALELENQYEVATDEEKSLPRSAFEVLILDEDIAPSKLAIELSRLGLRDDIEYIQPDYELSLESFELELVDESSATEEQVPETTQPETPPETETKEESEPEASEDALESEESLPEESTEEDSQLPEESEEEESVPEESGEVSELPEEELPENVPESEEKEEVSPSVIVAIIDTGVDFTHPDIEPYLWVNEGEEENGEDDDENGFVDDIHGWNFPAGTGVVYDEEYSMASAHGTHIAGAIAGAAEGYDADVQIMVLQVFDNGVAYTSDIIAAIQYATANGAQIINMSFGSTAGNPALAEAIAASDALFVSAAGNSRRDLVELPIYSAAYRFENTLSVSSTNADDGFSFYSNYGEEMIDLAARGREIESAIPGGGYGPMSGTSMSAAQVSAAAAVVLAAKEGLLTTEELRERLVETSDRLSNLQNKVLDGRRLNLENALGDLRSNEILDVDPADDFDVHGYQPTPEEQWELFSTSTIVQVAAGENHSLALAGDGTVWAFGRNNYGQLGNGTTTDSLLPVQVSGLTDVTAIAAGTYFSLVIKENGTVWAWGFNGNGRLGDGSTTDRSVPVQTSGLTGVIDIDGGRNHSIALKSDGVVWTWGRNFNGQLGNGSSGLFAGDKKTPVKVNNITGITDISAGDNHNIARRSDGTVWAWGENNKGQLGDGSTSTRKNPVQVSGIADAIAVEAGYEHSLALKQGGTVVAWGNNDSGRLGNNSTTSSSTPVAVSGLTDVMNISGGGAHSAAITSDGSVWSWGNNGYGRLGNNSTTNSSVPVQTSVLADTSCISMGLDFSLAVQSDGSVWAWGKNNYGQLGNGTSSNSTKPVTDDDHADVYTAATQIQDQTATGIINRAWDIDWFEFITARNAEYAIYLYCEDPQVQFQVYDADMTAIPLDAALSFNALADQQYYIKVFYQQTGAFTRLSYSISLYVDDYPYSPDNSYPVVVGNTRIPGKLAVPGDIDWIALHPVVSGDHIMALESDDPTVSFEIYNGNLELMQLGATGTVSLNQGEDYYAKIWKSAGPFSTPVPYALLSQREAIELQIEEGIFFLGNSMDTRAMDTEISWSLDKELSALDAFAMVISYESQHVLKNDGSVWTGENNLSESLGSVEALSRIDTLCDVIAISSKSNFNLALLADGTVWAWGNNDVGQLGMGTTENSLRPQKVVGLEDIVSISAGVDHCLALKANGTVWAWGNNERGQLGDGTLIMKNVPICVDIPANEEYIIRACKYYSMVFDEWEAVWTFGINEFDPDLQTMEIITPTPIDTLSGTILFWDYLAGGFLTKEDGTFWAWGLYPRFLGLGEEGSGSEESDYVQLIRVPYMNNICLVMDLVLGGTGLESSGIGWTWSMFSATGSATPIDSHTTELPTNFRFNIGSNPYTIKGYMDKNSGIDWITMSVAYDGFYSVSYECADPNVTIEIYCTTQNGVRFVLS